MTRGRSNEFLGARRVEVERLLTHFGRSKTQRILGAEKGSSWSLFRDLHVFPEPVSVSEPTLTKYAKNGNIRMRSGRPLKTA